MYHESAACEFRNGRLSVLLLQERSNQILNFSLAKNIVLCARSVIVELKIDCIGQNGFSFVQEVFIQRHCYLSMLAGCLLETK